MLVKGKSKVHYAFKILFLCCCLSASLNGMIVHCKGVFIKDIAQTIGVSATKYATYSIYGSLISIFTTPFLTKLFSSKSIKKVLCLYLFIFYLSTALVSFVTKMWQCYVLGVFQGITSAFLTVFPISYFIRNWFTKNKGLVTGIATMAAGLISTIMNIVLSLLIQSIGWRKTNIIDVSVAFLISIIPVLLFAVRNPEDIGLEPYGGRTDSESKQFGKERINKELLWSILPFILLTSTVYISSNYNQHLPNYAQDIGYTATFGASLISVCMLGNTASKLLLGYLNDRMGVYKTSLLTTISMALSFMVLCCKPKSTFILYFVVLFLGQGTTFIVVQIPLLLNTRFPNQKKYETSMSIVMITASVISSINVLLTDYLYKINNSYSFGHLLCFLLLAISAIMLIFLSKVKNKVKA